MKANKCPECNGCTRIIDIIDSRVVYHCDFCRTFYIRIAGGKFERVNGRLLKERKVRIL